MNNAAMLPASKVEVVHCLPGRVRLLAPGLEGNREMAGTLVQRLTSIDGVYLAEANPLTGRVLVAFSARRVQVSRLIEAVSSLIEKDQRGPDQGPGAPVFWEKAAAGGSLPVKKGLQEPEDLPIGKQFFNVALGGGVLAYLGLKHMFLGRTPLARHPHLFNLAAFTTILSGYPVFRSGLEGLTRGRINYDLVLGALALGTTLLRESIPGLMVIWLTNLTALGQSLVLKGYHSALPEIPALAEQPAQGVKSGRAPSWEVAGKEYSRQAVLPVLAVSSLAGLTAGAGGFQRALAMLLAANPSPAGLAAPTAVTAAMARAGRNGIFFRDSRAVAAAARVDTVIFHGAGVLPEASYQIGDVLPMPGIQKTELLELAAGAGNLAKNPGGQVLLQALTTWKRQSETTGEQQGSEMGQALVGDESILNAAGVETCWGIYKARRLRRLAQIPLYVAWQGKLAGLIGIRPEHAGDLRGLVEGLRALGIRHVLLALEERNTPVAQVALAQGIQTAFPDPSGHPAEMVRKLKGQGRRVAVVVGKKCDPGLQAEADVVLCAGPGTACDCAGVVLSHPCLLPNVFGMALLGEQRARQNLALVQAANAVGLVLGATGRLPPFLAKVYNNLIAVAVGANSLRLLPGVRRRKPERRLQQAEREMAAALEQALEELPAGRVAKGQDFATTGWHALTADEALFKLGSSLQGLQKQEARDRLGRYGPNGLSGDRPRGFLARLGEQFKDVLVKALLVSAALCTLLGELVDALAIALILAVNALLGALQEQKAEGALRALGKLACPTARVRRAGKVERIPARELVPGDIVLLECGDGVPADLRLLEANGLETEESALTGEPYPVAKDASQVSGCIPLLDCRNLAFLGTSVTRGRGTGLVVNTGMSTEFGKIAGMMGRQDRRPTPLQRKMAEAGGVFLKYSLAAGGLVAFTGLLRGGSLFKMLLTGISLAVAAIPEGLPAVVTMALASGVWRMAREKAVVRKLPAVETLGSTTLICTDKTGTLTQNRQLVQAAFTGSGWWLARVPGRPLTPADRACDPNDLAALLSAGIVCTDAHLKWSHHRRVRGTGPAWLVEGDPTEGALLLSGMEEGLDYSEIRRKWRRVKEVPFDVDRLRMAVVCRDENHECAAFVKGAPEIVLDLCVAAQQKGDRVPLDSGLRQKIHEANRRLTEKAMRVLAVAYRPLDDPEVDNPEDALIFLGLVGMIDPPRPEVRQAIAACRQAGIKVVMVTGDHPCTALAMSNRVGLSENQAVLTGQEIDLLSDLELAAAISRVRVFARVLPAQKLRLVQAFQQRGEVVTVIGDGINDAPAVKAGDIGVVMGRSGTDVTREASDIVLSEDNFATLVAAVEQGRGIHCNIRRSVRYLLSTNLGLVLLVLSSVALGLPMPLLPVQLLFLNVLGDGLPALALGVEPPGKGLMQQPPRPVEQGLFAEGLGHQIVRRGLATGLVGLETYRRFLRQGDLSRARTMGMATFAASKLFFALECAEGKKGSYSRHLLGSVALSFALLAGAVYLPLGRRIFQTVPLGLREVGAVLGAAEATCLLGKMLDLTGPGRDPKR